MSVMASPTYSESSRGLEIPYLAESLLELCMLKIMAALNQHCLSLLPRHDALGSIFPQSIVRVD